MVTAAAGMLNGGRRLLGRAGRVVRQVGTALPGTLRAGRARLGSTPVSTAQEVPVDDSLPDWATTGSMSNEEFITAAYQNVLGRQPDDGGRAHWLDFLRTGGTRAALISSFAESPEAGSYQAMMAFHQTRVQWMRSLPAARRILDLGGTATNDERGALLFMGYPHSFDDLVIVELPHDDRHELYQVPEFTALDTPQGPVRYLYRSMTDLDDQPDGSWDLVVSGQTFEHITQAEGAKLLIDIRRILAPGGFLALDTPNGAVTQLATGGRDKFINPDHKIEYTHEEMLALFDAAGLEVVLQLGLGYVPRSAQSQQWDVLELLEHPGMYADIEESYTLAYLARAAS